MRPLALNDHALGRRHAIALQNAVEVGKARVLHGPGHDQQLAALPHILRQHLRLLLGEIACR